MKILFSILCAVAAVAYKIYLEPSRRPVSVTWDYGVIAIYALVGFAIGWVLAIVFSRVRNER
jgi:hypothetical protein